MTVQYSGAPLGTLGNIVSGVFQPVLAKHSKHFSLQNAISIGVDEMQRNFDPMRKQVETWRQSQISDTAAKLTIYRAFISGTAKVRRRRRTDVNGTVGAECPVPAALSRVAPPARLLLPGGRPNGMPRSRLVGWRKRGWASRVRETGSWPVGAPRTTIPVSLAPRRSTTSRRIVQEPGAAAATSVPARCGAETPVVGRPPRALAAPLHVAIPAVLRSF